MDSPDLGMRLQELDGLQSQCTHCGLCAEVCSTYQATGWEQESPRGRILLARDFMNGKIKPDSPALSTFDHCLGCQACEKVCPVEVKYSPIRQIVQNLRMQLTQSRTAEMGIYTYRKWIKLAYRMGSIFWRHYVWQWMPDVCLPKMSRLKMICQSNAPKEITLVVSCVQDYFSTDLLQQTCQVLNFLNVSFNMDSRQPCCGAIFERLIHGDKESITYETERKKAIHFQVKRRDAFLKWLSKRTTFLAMGCQCFMKEHPQAGDKIIDWHEFLLEKITSQNIQISCQEPLTVYYQPYCGQGKRSQLDPVWRLLSIIQYLTVRLVFTPLSCCGGYKGECLLRPEKAQELLQAKLSSILKGAIVIVTSPDCQAQWQIHGKERALEVIYPIQLLAKILGLSKSG